MARIETTISVVTSVVIETINALVRRTIRSLIRNHLGVAIIAILRV